MLFPIVNIITIELMSTIKEEIQQILVRWISDLKSLSQKKLEDQFFWNHNVYKEVSMFFIYASPEYLHIDLFENGLTQPLAINESKMNLNNKFFHRTQLGELFYKGIFCRCLRLRAFR